MFSNNNNSPGKAREPILLIVLQNNGLSLTFWTAPLCADMRMGLY
jgi:hypothetical protein